MKLFFEDGVLKASVGESDTPQRQMYLHSTYHCTSSWEKGKTFQLFYPFEIDYMAVISAAKKYKLDIAQDVEDFYNYRMQQAEARQEAKRKREEYKRIIQMADAKNRSGCGMCVHLSYNSKRHYCEYAKSAPRYRSDEQEYAFECWKEARVLGTAPAFVATPYPCAGCVYMEEASRAWMEINKEREGNV